MGFSQLEAGTKPDTKTRVSTDETDETDNTSTSTAELSVWSICMHLACVLVRCAPQTLAAMLLCCGAARRSNKRETDMKPT